MSEETLSQQIINKANKTVSIVDDLGRTIVLKKPKFSAYLDLLKALGSELSKNEAYVQNVSILSTVVSIDGKASTLKAVVDVDFLIRKLEESDDALPKISQAVIEHFSDFKTQSEYEEEIKK
jgi:hypothetical protein